MRHSTARGDVRNFSLPLFLPITPAKERLKNRVGLEVAPESRGGEAGRPVRPVRERLAGAPRETVSNADWTPECPGAAANSP